MDIQVDSTTNETILFSPNFDYLYLLQSFVPSSHHQKEEKPSLFISFILTSQLCLLAAFVVAAGKAETAEEQPKKAKRGILLGTAGSSVGLELGPASSGGLGLSGLANDQLSAGVDSGAIVQQAPTVLVQRYPPIAYYARQSLAPVLREVSVQTAHPANQRPTTVAVSPPQPPVRLQASPISVSQHVNIPQLVSQSVPVLVSAVSSSSAGAGFASRIDSSGSVTAGSGLATTTDLASRGFASNLGYASSGGAAALGAVGALWGIKKRKKEIENGGREEKRESLVN